MDMRADSPEDRKPVNLDEMEVEQLRSADKKRKESQDKRKSNLFINGQMQSESLLNLRPSLLQEMQAQ